MIPYSRQYVPKKDFRLVKNVLNSNFLTQGPIVKKFEKKNSEYPNSKYALALNSATLSYVLNLAQNGYREALKNDSNFLAGLNVFKGQVTYKAVAEDLNFEYIHADKAIN